MKQSLPIPLIIFTQLVLTQLLSQTIFANTSLGRLDPIALHVTSVICMATISLMIYCLMHGALYGIRIDTWPFVIGLSVLTGLAWVGLLQAFVLDLTVSLWGLAFVVPAVPIFRFIKYERVG